LHIVGNGQYIADFYQSTADQTATDVKLPSFKEAYQQHEFLKKNNKEYKFSKNVKRGTMKITEAAYKIYSNIITKWISFVDVLTLKHIMGEIRKNFN
jgi:hypothetical protein